jgi:hypothetical protein
MLRQETVKKQSAKTTGGRLREAAIRSQPARAVAPGDIDPLVSCQWQHNGKVRPHSTKTLENTIFGAKFQRKGWIKQRTVCYNYSDFFWEVLWI